MTSPIIDRAAIAAVSPPRLAHVSPVEIERVRVLARRAIAGAPALTLGEVRELAEAIAGHNDGFAAYPVGSCLPATAYWRLKQGLSHGIQKEMPVDRQPSPPGSDNSHDD